MHRPSSARRALAVAVVAPIVAAACITAPRLARADAVAAPKPRPPAVYSPGVAFDVKRDRLVVFGGFRSGKGVFDETWEWDGLGWMQLANGSNAKRPPGRNDPILVYDPRRSVTLMYGGDANNETLNDTWTWDGGSWRKMNVEAPPGRFAGRGAYDSRRGEVVVVGGYSAGGVVREVWVWDGGQWTMRREQSPPRYLHGLTFNEKTNRLVTFGGNESKSNNSASGATGETWATIAGAWRVTATSGPSPRNHVNLACDESRMAVVMFGGAVADGFAQDTWEWDSRQWKQIAGANGPGPRANAALSYDPNHRRVLLYGGFTADGPKNDLWAWDGKTWTRLE